MSHSDKGENKCKMRYNYESKELVCHTNFELHAWTLVSLSQRSCDNEVRARSEDLPTERVRRKGVTRVRFSDRETCLKN